MEVQPKQPTFEITGLKSPPVGVDEELLTVASKPIERGLRSIHGLVGNGEQQLFSRWLLSEANKGENCSLQNLSKKYVRRVLGDNPVYYECPYCTPSWI
jgi:hypothetical protein